MRGSAETVAVARDVASSSPSKPAPALDMMRFQRPSSDYLPLPNGIATAGSGSGSRKPPAAPAPRSSKDDASPAVATDSSRLAAFLASTSLEPKPRARAPQPPAQAAPSSSSTAAAARSPARDHGNSHHHLSDFSDPTSPSTADAGGGGEVRLQWGQNKRLRGRRDGASGSGASPLRGQPGAKIQRRSPPVPADKLLMPPPSGPSYTRGSNLRSASPLPPRSGAGIEASDAHHGRGALPHHHRSAEEQRSGGKPAAAAGKQQRQAAHKAHKAGLGPLMGLGVQDPKQQQASGAGASSSAKLELPRIFTTLSRKEKEEDFMAMKGTKLPQRPKRRPKNVEKAVSVLHLPGDMADGRDEEQVRGAREEVPQEATEAPGPERDGEHGQRLRLTNDDEETCVAGPKGGGGEGESESWWGR